MVMRILVSGSMMGLLSNCLMKFGGLVVGGGVSGVLVWVMGLEVVVLVVVMGVEVGLMVVMIGVGRVGVVVVGIVDVLGVVGLVVLESFLSFLMLCVSLVMCVVVFFFLVFLESWVLVVVDVVWLVLFSVSLLGVDVVVGLWLLMVVCIWFLDWCLFLVFCRVGVVEVRCW